MTSWIYFIVNTFTKNIKIGFSDAPPDRLKALQTGNDCNLEIIGTMPGGRADEAALHRRFDGLRIPNAGREWFHGTPALYAAIDLLLNPATVLLGRKIGSVYLAGKITGDPWRRQILGTGIDPRYEPSDGPEERSWIYPRCVAVPGYSQKLDYMGPFWLDITNGHGVPNPGIHAFGEPKDDWDHDCRGLRTSLPMLRKKCLDGVSGADLVFAWIDSLDCYGTLAEIAWAFSRRGTKPWLMPVIIVASCMDPERLSEMWFITGMADLILGANSPASAWRDLWSSPDDARLWPPSEYEDIALNSERIIYDSSGTIESYSQIQRLDPYPLELNYEDEQ